MRARREMLSLTYEEIERHTRVRAEYQQALEEGALEDLPSLVQTRGILANYAGFLDLDVDAILLRFADGLQARHRERRPENLKRRRGTMTVNTSLPPLRVFIASDLLFGGGIAVLLILFAIWGITRVAAVGASVSAQATPPSISEILAGTPEPIGSQSVTVIPAGTALDSTALTGGPTITLPPPTLGPNINVQVNLVASESTYLRVTVDGKVQFEGRTNPGSAYPYEAQNQIEVLVGSASGIRVTYNGRDQGVMGNFGEVVDLIYTAKGIVTPTATPRPTATASPNVTPTPSQTPTSTPTATGTSASGG